VYQDGLGSGAVLKLSDDFRGDRKLKLFEVLFVEAVNLPVIIVLKTDPHGTRRTTGE
jgi:hypothetical protein